jgi:hypothetical protein
MIINGGMQVSQRATSVASITNDGYYTLDRFKVFNDTQGTFTMSKSTTAPSDQGLSSSLKMDCTTADASPAAGDRLGIRYYVEGQDMQHFKYSTSNAETTTLSFWTKSNKTGTYIVELYCVTDNRQISKAYTISVADTWEKKTITFVGDTGGTYNNDNTAELLVSFFLGAGTTYSSGTLSETWTTLTQANRAVGQVNIADNTANEWYITGVQLELGSNATPFEHRSYGEEFRRCQRYYYINNSLDVTLYHETGGSPTENCAHPVEMRAAPTITNTRQSGDGNATGVNIRNITTSNYNFYISGPSSAMREAGHNGKPMTNTHTAEL